MKSSLRSAENDYPMALRNLRRVSRVWEVRIANLDTLLGSGYFPSELPPSFNTSSFAMALMQNLHALPVQLRTPSIAKVCSYSFARSNFRFRRRLAIVNPLHYFNLCKCIANNWSAIAVHLPRAGICKSTPTYYPQKARAVSPQYERRELYRFQANARAGCTSILRADIADFYPSIYCHSIPWAFHTKAVAKVNRGTALFGNQLDKIIRNSQDGQTMGIPIGPDTSFIIAESVLSSVDVELTRRIPGLTGHRWIDEYELTFVERSHAEHALATLQQVLLEFELRLNHRKTKIENLPVEFEPKWTRELRGFRFRDSGKGQANDLIRYFDSITDYIARFPSDHVVKYGVARLRTLPVHRSNYDLFQSLLCQAMTIEPGAIREVIQAIYYAETQYGLVVDRRKLASTINTVLQRHALLGHDYEVSWCLWAALTWTLQIDAVGAAAISEMDNSIVAILALDANQQGLIPNGLTTTRWQSRMRTTELYEEQWLLAYEANIQGWLATIGGGDHVSNDAAFGFLKQHGVSFYSPVTNPIVSGALVYPP